MRVTNFVKKPNKSLLENRRSELVNNYCETLKKREMLLSILRNYQTMLERHLEMTNELKKIDSAKESVYRWHIASDKTLSNLNRLKKKYFKLAKINLAMASMCEKIVKFLEPYATKHLMNHSVKFDIQENNTLQKVNPRLLRDAIRRDGIVNNGSISQQFITNDTFNRDAYLDLNMQHICAHPKFSVLYLYSLLSKMANKYYFYCNYYFINAVSLNKQMSREIYSREAKVLDYLTMREIELSSDASRLYDIIQSYRKEYSQQFLECFTLYDKRSNLKEALTLFTSFGTLISTFSALYLYLKYKLGFTTISSLSISILPSVIAHDAVLRVMQKLLDYDISLTSANVHSVEELIRRTERIFDLELSELERKIAEIDVVLKNFDKNSNQ